MSARLLTAVKDEKAGSRQDACMIAADPSIALHSGVTRTAGSETVRAEAATVPAQTRHWTALAIVSLVVAGLLSLSVVVGRLPVISQLIGDPLFFKRCLVVHVDLALLVWFYTFIAALSSLRTPGVANRTSRASLLAAGAGMFIMMAGGLVPGAQPVLSNYIPVIDHPLFLTGLALFFAGVIVFFVQNLLVLPLSRAGGLPADAATGLKAAAVTVVLAAATWMAARTGLPEGLDAWTHYEFSSWGAGHVLQVANVCAMLAVWLWLLARATGHSVLTVKRAGLLFTALVVPHFAMPLLTWRGSLNTLYLDGATLLMRWSIFPVVLAVLVLSLRHLRRHRREITGGAARMAVTGFFASAALTVLGILIGSAIRGSTTLIPAHYHASLGGVTASFMAGAFLIIEAVTRDAGRLESLARLWRSARRQLILFGTGQSVFAIGFGIGGLYGLGRKTYATEQHVRSAGELTGLGIMGAGGLLAVAAGLWFLFLVIREMRRWRGAAADLHPSIIPTAARL